MNSGLAEPADPGRAPGLGVGIARGAAVIAGLTVLSLPGRSRHRRLGPGGRAVDMAAAPAVPARPAVPSRGGVPGGLALVGFGELVAIELTSVVAILAVIR